MKAFCWKYSVGLNQNQNQKGYVRRLAYIPKLLVVEEVGGANFHGFIFFGLGKMKFL